MLKGVFWPSWELERGSSLTPCDFPTPSSVLFTSFFASAFLFLSFANPKSADRVAGVGQGTCLAVDPEVEAQVTEDDHTDALVRGSSGQKVEVKERNSPTLRSNGFCPEKC